jgi:phosphoglycerol transferase
LKLAPLVLPIEFHILPPLAKLRARYDRSSVNFNNESATGTLGAVGSAGLLALLGWTLFARGQARKQPLIDALATMNLALVLLAMVGGFGMLFSLLIHPQFRAYNRVSVFVAFLSLAAVATGLEWLERRWCQRRRRVAFYALLGALLTLAILDQSPATLRPGVIGEIIARSQFEADAAFVGQMEALVPEGAAVYQLPYVWFPERAGVEKMGDYEHFRPYLHAKSLAFSYGCMHGRSADCWHRKLSDLPTAKLLEAIADAGYAGVYIDRRGYADEAKGLEADLAALLGRQPLVSGTGEQSFFALSH